MGPKRPSRHVALAVALAALAACPASGEDSSSGARRAWHGEIEQAMGFAPALCAGPMVAPELLARADWPLDADGRTCRTPPTHGRGDDRYAIEDVMEHPSVVPVVADALPVDAAPIRVGALALAAAVDEEELAGLRGGFEFPGGLTMSFGLERLVYINGVLESTTRLTVAELGGLLATGISSGGTVQATQAAQTTQTDPSVQTGQAAPATPSTPLPVELGATLAVIQSGAGNSVATGILASGALGTLIQNSLNDQRIQIVTTIDAQVNSMELLRADRLGESIRNAIDLR